VTAPGSIATRVATESDLDALVEIYNHAVEMQATADTEPVTPSGRREWFRSHDPGTHPIVVATTADGVVGWSSFSPHRPSRQALRHTAEISYYVHRDHRRRGVGTALIRDAIERCPALGFRTLFGILLDDNEASVALLERFGFRRWGHLPRVADFGGREVGHLYYGLRVDESP
jgi:phosphinothricin acetyltransferase